MNHQMFLIRKMMSLLASLLHAGMMGKLTASTHEAHTKCQLCNPEQAAPYTDIVSLGLCAISRAAPGPTPSAGTAASLPPKSKEAKNQ